MDTDSGRFAPNDFRAVLHDCEFATNRVASVTSAARLSSVLGHYAEKIGEQPLLDRRQHQRQNKYAVFSKDR